MTDDRSVLLARVAELQAERDALREQKRALGPLSDRIEKLSIRCDDLRASLAENVTARDRAEDRADEAEARVRVQAGQIAALQEALRQIVKTPYRDWHLNARIAREALALAEGCAAPADECDCAPQEWQVVHVPTGSVVTTYDSEQDAEAAVAWHEKTYGGSNLEVRQPARAPADEEAK